MNSSVKTRILHPLQIGKHIACGDVENGLIFSGANAGYTQNIISVPELMTELTQTHTIEVSSSDKY